MYAVDTAYSNPTTSVRSKGDLLKTSSLYNNYPNPFKRSTVIRYTVADGGRVSLRVFAASGQLVRTLVNTSAKAGTYTATWDGTNDNGRSMSRGVYIYQLLNGDVAVSKKMFFVR